MGYISSLKCAYTLISLTCRILKKCSKKVNITEKKQTHRYKLVVTNGKGGRDNTGVRNGRYKLLGVR